ncbi:MAG TPA: ATP-binding protein [Solirubrobacteraceae bacterium]
MKLIDRGLADTVVTAMGESRVVALLGARQAGKSTLARMLAAERLPADYLTLDDEPVRSLAAGDPQGFVAGLGRRTIVDEIQRAPELLLAIKSRVDRDGAPGQFLLTGSANLRRIPTVADALPGRVDYLTLWPLTQGEVRGRPESFLASLFAGEFSRIGDAPVGRGEYAEILLAGGFPEARTRTAAARRRFFASYVTSIVERDVADTSRVHDPTSVGTLLGLVAARSGSLARYDALAREAGIDGKTAKGHLAVLERLFLVRIRQPWHVNLGKRQVKAPKLYVADPGLLAALIGADERRLREDDGFAGALFETFVATELERQASWAPEALRFWHFREADREVDVIVERPSGEVAGIEVKASATVRAQDFRGLVHMRERLGKRLVAGVVLYAGEQTLPFGEGLWALPLSALWS